MASKAKLVDLAVIAKPNDTEMVTETVTVTPELARAFLDSMPAQRRIRQAKIRLLTRQVLDGRWRLTPHGLVFNQRDQMIDGQHRCTVICETNVPLVLRVTRNASDESYLVIDSGASPKTLDDALHHEGMAKGMAVIAAAPIRMLFREGRGASIWDGNFMPSNVEGVETYYLHPEIGAAVEMAARVKVAPSRGSLAYFIYKTMAVDRGLIEAFVDGLITGEMLRNGDPALLLRNTWVLERNSRVSRTLLDDGIRIASAINAALRGRRMTSWRGIKFAKGLTPVIGE